MGSVARNWVLFVDGPMVIDGVCRKGRMKLQTAREISHEYEVMAINAANQHYRLKQQNPFEELAILAKHVSFCTTMHIFWQEIAEKMARGPEIYDNDDTDTHDSEWGLM